MVNVRVVQKSGSVAIDKQVTQQLKLGWRLYGSPFDLQGNTAQLMVQGEAPTGFADTGEYRLVQKDGKPSAEDQIAALLNAGWKLYGDPLEVYGLSAQAMVKGDVAIELGAGSAGGTQEISASDIVDATETGIAIIKAFNAPEVRQLIGAGTSSLALGSTNATAKAGDYKPTTAEVGNALKQKSGISALTKIADPTTATTEQVATLLNAVVDALKA